MDLWAFNEVAKGSRSLIEFDSHYLQSTSHQNENAFRTSACIIDILDGRRVYRGTTVPHGSFTRGTNLREHGLNDIDILCYISEDRNGTELSSLQDFQMLRKAAMKSIVKYLVNNLPDRFARVVMVAQWTGLCVQFQVKDYIRDPRVWKIDVIFAFEAQDYEETFNELYEMSMHDAMVNINALSHWKNEFVQDQYDQCPDLKTLVRLLKYFNKRVGQLPPAKHVNSFVFESMVAILYENGIIPLRFDMSRALCTCIWYIGYPEDIWANSAEPTEDELSEMRRNCGDDGLIIVDPVAPFNNIAARTNRTERAWKILTRKAKQVFHFLQDKVTPYW